MSARKYWKKHDSTDDQDDDDKSLALDHHWGLISRRAQIDVTTTTPRVGDREKRRMNPATSLFPGSKKRDEQSASSIRAGNPEPRKPARIAPRFHGPFGGVDAVVVGARRCRPSGASGQDCRDLGSNQRVVATAHHSGGMSPLFD